MPPKTIPVASDPKTVKTGGKPEGRGGQTNGSSPTGNRGKR